MVYTGASAPYGRIVTTPSSGMTSTLTLTFVSMGTNPLIAGVENGSLTDGRWRLAIPTLGYQSALNDTTLRRLFGDSNNDGTVDASDLAAFGNVFGATVANNPFDFDNNSSINATDFAEFGNRFGLTL